MHQQIPEYYPEPTPWKRLTPWVTWTLVGSTVAVFLLQLIVAHFEGEDLIGDALAFSPDALAEGRYWTFFTYAWAHAVIIFNEPDLFWLHIVANMVPLACFGPALEDFLGHWRYLGLYLGGVLASALFWYAFNSGIGSDASIIGASGAIFALIAAAGTVAPRERVLVFLFFVLPLRMNLMTLALIACGIELIQIVFDWMPEVAHSVHLGGAAFGCVYVLVLRFISRRLALRR